MAEVELPSGGEASGIVLTLKPVGRLEVRATTTDRGTAVDNIAVRLERDGEPTREISGRATLGSFQQRPCGYALMRRVSSPRGLVGDLPYDPNRS